MKYASGTASTVGFTMEETTAAMMAMADVGLQGSVAGQAFATSLGRLAKPTGEAKKAIDAMNISFFDQQGKIKPLPNIIKDLEQGMSGMTNQQKTATLQTIFGAEAFKNWAALLKTGGDQLEKNTEGLIKSEGAADKMSKTMNANLIGSWDNFKSKLEGLAITMFERLAPAFYGILEGATAAVLGVDKFIQALIPLEPMMNGVTNLTTALQGMWAAAGGNAEAGIDAVNILTKMGLTPEAQEMAQTVIFSIRNGIDLLKSLVTGDWGAASNIAQKLGLSPEAQAQIIGVAASIHNAVSSLVEGISSVVSAMAPVVMGIIGGIWSFIQGVFSAMAPYIMSAINGIASFTSSMLNQIASFWQQNGQQISQAVSVAFSFIQSVISAVMPIIAFIVEGTWEGIKNVISGALDIIMGVIKVFSSVLTGDWRGLWEGIKQILSGAWDLLVGLVELGVGKVTGIVTKFVPGLKGIFEPVTDFLAKPFELAWKAIDKVIGWITSGWDKVSGIIGSVKEGASALGGFVGGLLPFSAPTRSVSPPSVNGFASGGIFKPNQERMIKIGDAKSYDEAVLPLNKGTLGEIGKRIAETMPFNRSYDSKPIQITNDIHIDGRRFARQTAAYMDEELGRRKARQVRV
ncbi:phage tail tape measure protein (plasmid) [Bacillus tropicus]|nr:phage tail tape measure protein [Bacillus tropicus]